MARITIPTLMSMEELNALKAKLERGEQPTEIEMAKYQDTAEKVTKFCADFMSVLSTVFSFDVESEVSN